MQYKNIDGLVMIKITFNKNGEDGLEMIQNKSALQTIMNAILTFR